MLKKLVLSLLVCGSFMGVINEDAKAMGNSSVYQAAWDEYSRQKQEGNRWKVINHYSDVVRQMEGFDCEDLGTLLRFLKNTHEHFQELPREQQIAFAFFLYGIVDTIPGETANAASSTIAIDFASILLGESTQYGHHSLDDFEKYF